MAAAPRLSRLIAESTQPFGPADDLGCLRALEVHSQLAAFKGIDILLSSPGAQVKLICSLQGYLGDQDSVDAVLEAIVERASAEPVRYCN